MKRRSFTLFSIMIILSLIFAIPVSAKDKNEGGLKPGEIVTFEQKVPVNVVFIGYDKKSIDTQTFLDTLPSTYSPIVRYPPLYGIPGRDMGLKFNFEYNLSFKDSSFSRKFFNYMKGIGVSGDPTLYQTFYNDQVNNVLDVNGPGAVY
ncbi:hypothetical protein [Candidatus Villigracilis saccharophilus]|uniref:hypothetical protein n=1 Tax=Candidatus Villigracilis saccharophilus TaxID=3140684 RepID=UPI0031350000|nr:hypothetical protein [Anaerolineales bacterium]